MADTGFQNPSATGAVYNDWTEPTKAYTSDNQRASFSITANPYQDYYNFNFNIPEGATIDGIEVGMEGYCTAGDRSQFKAALSGDGGATWTASKFTPYITTSEETYTLGGPTDTWGKSWAASNFSNTNFRILCSNNYTPGKSQTDYVDHVKIKVYYTTVEGVKKTQALII